MSLIPSQITSLAIVYLTVYSGADQRKYQSSASLTFVWGIHQWPNNFPHKGPVTRKMLTSDDVIVVYWHQTQFMVYLLISNVVRVKYFFEVFDLSTSFFIFSLTCSYLVCIKYTKIFLHHVQENYNTLVTSNIKPPLPSTLPSDYALNHIISYSLQSF